MKFLIHNGTEVVEQEANSADDLGLVYAFNYVPSPGCDAEVLKSLVFRGTAIGIFDSISGKGTAGYATYRSEK